MGLAGASLRLDPCPSQVPGLPGAAGRPRNNTLSFRRWGECVPRSSLGLCDAPGSWPSRWAGAALLSSKESRESPFLPQISGELGCYQ